MQKRIFRSSVLILAWFAVACQAGGDLRPPLMEINPPARGTAPVDAISEGLPPEDCPVTLPPAPAFVPPAPYSPDPPYPDQFWFGSPSLWTLLPVSGSWGELPVHDGLYTQKVFWWRQGYDWLSEPQPELAMSASGLSGHQPTLEFDPPATNGNHNLLGSFMLAGLELPGPGCWQITGRYQGHELSFVIWIES